MYPFEYITEASLWGFPSAYRSDARRRASVSDVKGQDSSD